MKEVLGDQPRFSSWRGGISIKDSSERSLAAQRQMLITMDPPEHTAHRLTVNRRFVPRSIEEWHERISVIASETIDHAVSRRRRRGGRATSSRRSRPRSPSS